MFRMTPIKVKSFESNVLKEFADILDKNIEKMNDFAKICNKNGISSKVNIFNNNAADLFDIAYSSYAR
ncbi:hypothetical protein [Brachyspira hampsonii]|uniref:PspGI methylase n=1 Tax=Brachyspira hampsonii 30446 TaxID=1289135 RepID=A0A2U4FKW7_9SPIR|nr:hypothetical protein [Brachyspira hampsonii]EKV58061.1 PspGI methylase [Brachyspira hampsonii 30446]OEJ16754.1 hypothetical protein A9495_08680 [Brachyspira hampsonii]